MDLITLADLPALQGSDPKPRSTIVIGRLDDNLRDPRYGRFKITQAQVDGWKRNLSDTFGGQVSIDFDHSSDRGNGTRAAAWIKSIGQDGKLITADVEFSKRGARAVRNGDYRYTSPTFVENYTDEHGEKHGPALIGAALTNRPVLRKGMPTLSLSRDEFEGVATVVDQATRSERKRARTQARRLLSTPEPARDSRGHMDLAELAKLLDLPADADQVTVLAAVANLKPPANDSSDDDANQADPAKGSKKARKLAKQQKASKTMALADGTEVVALSAEDYAELLKGANAGMSAATELAEDRFTHAYEKALSEGRAAPSQEDNLRELHKLDPELAIKTLDSFVRIVPTRPAGSGDHPNTGPAPMGMDDDRFQLHQEATQVAEQKVKNDPQLDPGEAYALAAVEIEDRKFLAENPGAF